jgi:hypothetical protein
MKLAYYGVDHLQWEILYNTKYKSLILFMDTFVEPPFDGIVFRNFRLPNQSYQF